MVFVNKRNPSPLLLHDQNSKTSTEGGSRVRQEGEVKKPGSGLSPTDVGEREIPPGPRVEGG